MTPFSNGSEAMSWYSENCEKCIKAYFPIKGIYPSDQTMKSYASKGKECKLKYNIDKSFILGKLDYGIAKRIGLTNGRLNHKCEEFSTDKKDAYKPKPRPKDKQNYKLF